MSKFTFKTKAVRLRYLDKDVSNNLCH